MRIIDFSEVPSSPIIIFLSALKMKALETPGQTFRISFRVFLKAKEYTSLAMLALFAPASAG
jgi:hypothetical protein